MTRPTLSLTLESALDDLEVADNTLTIALDDANHIGLAPFRVANIQAAIDDLVHATQELNTLVQALKVAYPDSPL